MYKIPHKILHLKVKLDINTYIPDVNRLYDYKSITGKGHKNIVAGYELIEKNKYRHVETRRNEYKINDIYKV